MEKYCAFCGNSIEASAKFCSNCGVALKRDDNYIENPIQETSESTKLNKIKIFSEDTEYRIIRSKKDTDYKVLDKRYKVIDPRYKILNKK
ncbi:MAG: zinc ribbon domain-containing protein [Promethearchaeota archaeon]